MDSSKRSNETEMGSGDSDDEFYNVKFPYTLEVASDKNSKKVEVKKVYSPPRTKIQYDYKFDSSSDEESETRSSQKDLLHQETFKSSEKKFEGKEESSKENVNLPQSTFKVVEKINEELKSMKNSGTKLPVEKIDNLTGQSHTVASVPTTVSVPRPSIGVIPPVVVVPPMVVPQAPVMGPMIVPSALSMGGPMAVMQSQSMMGNMIRSQNPIGITSNAISNSMMGMSTVPGMMSIQGNFMGVAGGMINPAAMGAAINMAMPGNMMRMPVAGSGMFRMQGPGNNMLGLQGANNMMGISRHSNSLVGVPRPVNIPPPPSSLMVSNPIMTNTGGLMTMSGMMNNQGAIINSTVAGANQTGNSVGNNNMLRMANSSQGNLSVRVPPPPPPFLSFRGRPSVPPGNLRWQANTKIQPNVPKVDSPTVSSPSIPSPNSSPVDKSSKDYDGDEFSRDYKDKSPSIDTDESQSPPREIPNTFKNDGSFMEMFKKMTEESENNQEALSSNDKSGHSETSDSSSTLKKPAVMLSGIVGKRRGGRVLKTGLVKKVKKEGEAEEEKHPKDAWSMYMAEVKKYREASCEEEGKTRPLEELEKMTVEKDTAKERLKENFGVPLDPRFPNCNQTKHCYQYFIDFQRCSKKRGEDFEACQYFKKIYKRICPIEWIEKWEEQVAEKVFPGRI